MLKGLTFRGIPVANPDSGALDAYLRLDTYGGMFTQPRVRKAHTLADEGSYFVVNNAQTAIVPTYGTAYSATAPFIIVQNNAPAGGPRTYIDYANLTAAVAGTFASGGVQTALAVDVDLIPRFSSGGTNLTANIVNPNTGSTAAPAVAVYCGALTALAASANVRHVVGQRNIRPANSATVIGNIGDVIELTHGAVEGNVSSSSVVTNPLYVQQALPPIVLAPQTSALFYLYWPGATTPAAATYLPE
ncbi:MAG: hypothetical protein ACRETS_01535, partial [Steroidobacteraceae bacterium]